MKTQKSANLLSISLKISSLHLGKEKLCLNSGKMGHAELWMMKL